jgi:hypothetical protein
VKVLAKGKPGSVLEEGAVELGLQRWRLWTDGGGDGGGVETQRTKTEACCHVWEHSGAFLD